MARAVDSPAVTCIPEPLSANREVDEALRADLRRAIPEILTLAAGDRPVALFLSGSASWGEFVAVSDGGRLRPLSDVDLSLVSERRTAPVVRALREGLARWFGVNASGPWTACPFSVGTYALANLPRQNPTLGVAELRRADQCLWGRREVLWRFPDPLGEGIRPWEIVRLLLNRSLELVEILDHASRGGAEDALCREYVLSKLGADLATSLLASTGSLRWGAAERARAFRAEAPRHGWPEAMVEGVADWTRRRLEPVEPSEDRMRAWPALTPLHEVVPGLRWTWRRLLRSWGVSEDGDRAVLSWEPVGLRQRLRRLRRSLRAGPDGHDMVKTRRLWWETRPARSLTASLSWSCLRFLLHLPATGPLPSRAVPELGPWVRTGEGGGGDPEAVLRRLGRWIPWVRRTEV